jgi:hypothetical protein
VQRKNDEEVKARCETAKKLEACVEKQPQVRERTGLLMYGILHRLVNDNPSEPHSRRCEECGLDAKTSAV